VTKLNFEAKNIFERWLVRKPIEKKKYFFLMENLIIEGKRFLLSGWKHFKWIYCDPYITLGPPLQI
jgi:hypothetical protein